LFRREWLGFEDAVGQLIEEGLLDRDLVYGAFEIAKKFNSGLRLVGDRNGKLQNPRIGAAYQLGADEGIVCPTGFPFPLRGTACPLAIRIREGPLKLDWVMEDVFRKSLLAWSAPDHCLSVPIDLKLGDEFLRAFAADADEEEALYGEEVEEPAEAV
jgi:argonaute-like protein implicated in RNA metabolism and viral defense